MGRATITEVAAAAGVSTATVSRVLNGRGGSTSSTAEHVRATAARLGYAPNALARMLVTQQSLTVGVLQPALATMFSAQILDGVEKVAAEAGYSVVICSTGEDSAQLDHYIRFLSSRQVDAAIVVASSVSAEQDERFRSARLPYVVVTGSTPGIAVPVLGIDDQLAAFDGASCLLVHGHRRIAMIAGTKDYPAAGASRVEGFQAALLSFGVQPDPALVTHGDFSFWSGQVAMRRLLDQHPGFTAVFAASDDMAVGAISVAHDCGLGVPQDLSVVGFDGSLVARMAIPPLVSVGQPLNDMGRQAMSIAISLARGEEVPPPDVVPHMITKGESISVI